MIIAVAAAVMFLFALWAFLKQCAGWLSRFGSAWPPATGRSKSIRFKIAPLTSRILCVLLRCRVWHSLVFVCTSPGGESGLALVAASVMIMQSIWFCGAFPRIGFGTNRKGCFY